MARRVWTVVFSAAILFQAASRVGAQTVSLTVTPTATAPAATKYAYVVVVKTSQKLTIVSVEQANNAGPATLSAAEYVDVTWTYTPSADTGSVASIDIYRTAGGATQGKIASYGAGATTLRDNGLIGDKSKVPAASVLPPIVTPVPAGGMTSYGYVVVARTVQGGVSVGPKGTSSTGPETLSLTATNRVQWPAKRWIP